MHIADIEFYIKTVVAINGLNYDFNQSKSDFGDDLYLETSYYFVPQHFCLTHMNDDWPDPILHLDLLDKNNRSYRIYDDSLALKPIHKYLNTQDFKRFKFDIDLRNKITDKKEIQAISNRVIDIKNELLSEYIKLKAKKL